MRFNVLRCKCVGKWEGELLLDHGTDLERCEQ